MAKDPTQKPVLLSGIQPTNNLTLGNYLGAIKNWVKLQNDYQCYFMAVDLHAITTPQDPKLLAERTYRVLATYLASGIDPKQAMLFVQSHVPEHSELAWIMTCFSTMGELSRMTQFKDKADKEGKHIPSGLFVYPTLMAADILLYQTNLVPVGQDQKQHLELTREIAIRMNNRFQTELFAVPEPFIAKIGAKIMDLQNPTNKMGKSETSKGTLFLTESDDEISKKVKRAVTDSGSDITYEDSKPGLKNLLSIQAALTGNPIEGIVASYRDKQYGQLKVETADLVVNAIRPLREETERLMKDRGELDRILKLGATRAREVAHTTLEKVQELLGFVRPMGS